MQTRCDLSQASQLAPLCTRGFASSPGARGLQSSSHFCKFLQVVTYVASPAVLQLCLACRDGPGSWPYVTNTAFQMGSGDERQSEGHELKWSTLKFPLVCPGASSRATPTSVTVLKTKSEKRGPQQCINQHTQVSGRILQGKQQNNYSLVFLNCGSTPKCCTKYFKM